MLKSRLYKIASSLNEFQLQSCQDYIQVHYSGKAEAVLFDHLFNCLSVGNVDQLSKSYIANELFAEPIKVKRLGNLLSDTTRLVKRALEDCEFRSEEQQLQRLKYLAEAYRKANLIDRYQAVQNKIKTLLFANKTPRQVDYWERAQYFQSVYYQSTLKSYTKMDLDALQQAQFNLRVLSTFSQFIVNCELMTTGDIVSECAKPMTVQVDEDVAQIPTIQLYMILQELLDGKSKKTLEKAESFLFQHLDCIHRDDLMRCFTLIVNTYAYLIRNNQIKLSHPCLKTYKKGLANDLLVSNSKISAVRFNNITAVATYCEDWEWGSEFIETHGQFLSEAEREHTVQFAKANLLFGEKKYNEVIELLRDKKGISLGDELRRRLQLMCALVEVHEHDENLVWSHIDSFTQLLSTKELLNSGITTGMNNFLRILKLLLKGDYSKKAIQDELDNAASIYKRSWLEERLERYKQQKFLST